MSASTANGASPARVFLRPIGSPLTIGMAGLAVASLVESGLSLHWLASDQYRLVGLILLAVPFVLQLVACIFSYLARDGAGGAAIGLLAGTWLGVGLIHISAVPGARSAALGLMLLASAGALACSSLGVAVSKPLPALVFLTAAVRFALDGIYEVGGISSWQHVAGIVGLVIAGLAGYCVMAFELEGQLHHPVLPTFRRGVGKRAIVADAGAQMDGVVNEAGVRQTT